MGIHTCLDRLLDDTEITFENIVTTTHSKPISAAAATSLIPQKIKNILIIDIITLVYMLIKEPAESDESTWLPNTITGAAAVAVSTSSNYRDCTNAVFVARLIYEYLKNNLPVNLDMFSCIYLAVEGMGHRKKYTLSSSASSYKDVKITKKMVELNKRIAMELRDLICCFNKKCKIYVISGASEADVQIASIIELYTSVAGGNDGGVESLFNVKQTGTLMLSKLRSQRKQVCTQKRNFQKLNIFICTSDSDILLTVGSLNQLHLNMYWIRRTKLHSLIGITWQVAILLILFGNDINRRILTILSPAISGVPYLTYSKALNKVFYHAENQLKQAVNTIECSSNNYIPTIDDFKKEIKRWYIYNSSSSSSNNNNKNSSSGSSDSEVNQNKIIAELAKCVQKTYTYYSRGNNNIQLW